jgi:hypothetical protein
MYAFLATFCYFIQSKVLSSSIITVQILVISFCYIIFINLVTIKFCYNVLFLGNNSREMVVVKVDLIVHIVQSNLRASISLAKFM